MEKGNVFAVVGLIGLAVIGYIVYKKLGGSSASNATQAGPGSTVYNVSVPISTPQSDTAVTSANTSASDTSTVSQSPSAGTGTGNI